MAAGGGNSGGQGGQTSALIPAGNGDLLTGRVGAASADGTTATGRLRGVAGGSTERKDRGALAGLAAWANFTWAGAEDRNSAAASDTQAYMGIAGADYALSDRFIIGTALTFGSTAYKARFGGFEADEFSIGINPYVFVRLSEQFSVDAVAGYGHAFAESRRTGNINGDYGADRYFVGTNLSWTGAWDAARLMTSGGVLWGQSFQDGYRESNGAIVEGRRADFGQWKLLAQPSYIFTLDRRAGMFLEPFLVGEWTYGFATTKIQGHSNDRDGFRLGGGASLYAGSNLSANVQASTTVGKEDQRQTQVQGTLRYNF